MGYGDVQTSEAGMSLAEAGGFGGFGGEAPVAKGGLMNKNKLAQQMKQSGLASKK